MKKYILMSLFTLSNIMIFSSEKHTTFHHQDYSQQDLILARLAWAHQENRVQQLQYEASNIAHNHIVNYITGEAGHVAIINANNYNKH